jgi:hypothetical protein
MEVIKAMWDKSIEEALVIWRDRARGIINYTSCPFCDISNLLGRGAGCSPCILNYCFTSPYGMWQHYTSRDSETKKSAGDMVKMLEAYRDGNMDLFNRYLKYWDMNNEVCVFEEAST